MTQEELIQREQDLDIEITPEIEDAFYFLRILEKAGEIGNDIDENETLEEYEKRLNDEHTPALNAGDRLAKLPYDERMKAIHYGYQMLDNIKKYGVACSEWEKS